ncbi:MAG: hypothetical protein AB7G47_21500 [Mycolicibacterium sp.]|uniref:hypothetical protein n=1 Tax=Mycolicibacterium sp. TaxID=2320850 RepID=UPI003D14078F
MATILALGTLAIDPTITPSIPTLAAAPAAPVVSSPVRLLANTYQPLIDKIIEAQVQIINTNSTYSFITQSDLSSLPSYAQTLTMSQLSGTMNLANLAQEYELSGEYLVYPWNAPAADPLQFINDPNSDNQYFLPIIDENQIYVMTIQPGPGTTAVTFTPQSGIALLGNYESTEFAYNLTDFTPNADGSYTILMSNTQQSGNWVNTTGAQSITVRNTIDNWGLLHNTISFKPQDAPATFTLPVLSSSQIEGMLDAIATYLPTLNSSVTLFGIQEAFGEVPDNTFTPIELTSDIIGGGPILAGQYASIGSFNLGSDEALIVQVPNVDAEYTGADLSNVWQLDLPYVTVQSSINSSHVFRANDGYTYYVVSSQDPGVANWLGTSGVSHGTVNLRFQGLTGSVPTTPLPSWVVPVADVQQYLPADTPTVSPTQRAANHKQLLLEYNYKYSQYAHPTGWVTANLEIDQVRDAIGAQEFVQLFGSQSNLPSVLDRAVLDRSLIPNFLPMVETFVTDPLRSLGAIVNNLPLMVQDIVLPMVLATLRWNLLVGQTSAAELGNLLSGNLGGVVAEYWAGFQDAVGLVEQTLFDPATSIAAGILNARDAFAVAMTNASSYSPLSWSDIRDAMSQICQLGESVIRILAGGFTGMVELIGSSDGADATVASALAATPEATEDSAATVESGPSESQAPATTNPLPTESSDTTQAEQGDSIDGGEFNIESPQTGDSADGDNEGYEYSIDSAQNDDRADGDSDGASGDLADEIAIDNFDAEPDAVTADTSGHEIGSEDTAQEGAASSESGDVDGGQKAAEGPTS